jgi:glucose/arabinose dehydrogenase/type 1 glutamine amidotransferase/regulation of enolase protein 1 (concanavalin A-like superfamily)
MTVTRHPRWARLLAATVASVLTLALLTVLPSQAHEGEHADAHVLIFTKTTAFRHTEAITQGVPVLEAAFAEAGISSEHTEDSSIFNDQDLSHFDAIVMFQASGDPWTADEKAALERYQQAGGGIVAIHNAADMRGNYTWWDELIGSLMPGHAATGTSPGLTGTVRIEDQTHASTSHLPPRWDRADEWYNFSTNVRGTAHVLATMDETTYDPGSNAMGYDHPISWCKPYDGGRAWVTAMGHFGAHYTEEPDFIQHIVGGVEWAAGLVESDCGGTVWSQYERVPLDTNTSAPFAIDVAPDGRVFFSELVRGQIRVYDPTAQTTSTALTLPVYSGGEDGLMSIALDPSFAENGHLFVYYAPASDDDTDPANFVSRVSRFTVGDGSQIDPASEVLIMEVPASRLPDEPGHTGGGLAFAPDGTLFLSVGDDVNPHSEPSGGYAPLSEREGTFHDARETSANTNDLRGKLLRITPEPDGGYSIPAGNMFAPGTPDTLPEIYAMGFRNPFRFSIDPETGWVGLADYGPDNSNSSPDRGPAGIVEYNLIKEPGFYGWPLCIGPNEPYLDVDYTTNPVTVGDPFDCDNPINDSTRNTGLTELPPVQEPVMYYGYQVSSVPDVIPAGGGLAPMGGPFYDFDPTLESETKFPEYYDGKPFFYEWAKNNLYSLDLTGDGSALEKINDFLPDEQWMAPIDSEFGPDGSLYVLDWGGGFGRDNPASGLYRVDYVSGSRSPEAVAAATPDSGHAPLTVQFDGSASTDPEGEELTYAWDFDNDGTVDATTVAAEHTYTGDGVFDARLTVTDPQGKTGTTTVPITVGNTRPEVGFNLPPTGAFFDFGDEVSWDLSVTDVEDSEINDADVVIQPALGHDDHAHPAEPLTGRTGSVVAALGGGHGEGTNVFYAIDGRYTDSGGAGGIAPLTGSDTTLLFPKQREAEFFEDSQDVNVGPSRDIEGHDSAVAGENGAWTSYDPVNLANVDALVLRVSAASAGVIELRRDAPDGELLGTADVPATGGATGYVDVSVAVTDPGDSFTLYAVFPGAGERRLNFIEADGKGVSPTTKPKVAVTAPGADDDLEPGEIAVTAEASDQENTITEVEFFVDGESIGADTEAPYATTWTVTEERRYQLTAVATNDLGVGTTSRIVQVEVGDLFGDWQTFSNADGTFDRPDTNTWVIDSAGANMWQGTDEYSSAYLPAAGDDQWTATVRIESQTNSANSAKAGLIVRNDITAPGSSPGYAAMTMRAGLGFEWLRDTDGNGQLDASTGASTTSYPAWVRIVRDGDQYTGYWSKDGETFTQVGDPVVLPGATAIQDIGLAVTAHSTTARSDVVFTDFAVVDGVPDPDPDPDPDPVPGPACNIGGSDVFDGDELNTTRWTVVREADGLPVSVADGSLVLPVTNGDINEGATGPVSYVGQPVREGEWQIETEVSIEHTREWQHAALLMHGSDDDYVKLAFTRNSAGGRIVEFQTEAGGTRTWHDNQSAPADFPPTIHLRLTSDGAQLTAAYSADGEVWTELAGAAQVIDGASVGPFAAGDTGAHEVNAEFAHFTVTPDSDDDGTREPSDEFDGDALDGCRWDSVVRYDSSTVAVTGGELHIETQPGDINGSNNDDPRNFILQDVPEGDWTVETRLTPSMLHQWQLAGVMVYGDDDNYVKFDVVASNPSSSATELGAELVSERNGQFGNGGNRQLDIPETTESGWYYLRLTKSGTAYAAEISGDAVNWTSLGDPVTNDAPMVSFGLMAIGPQQQEAVTVAFDYFRVPDDVVDVTPPVVEITTEPETADGQNGWYVTTPVVVTAAATDDGGGQVTIETRTGDGDWAAYAGPVELAEDGSHQLEFRATDEDGNTSEPVAVEIQIDATAPDLAIDGVEDGATITDLVTALEVAAVADDSASGVVDVTLTLDGDEVGNPASAAPALGEHVLTAAAIDEAGNTAEVTVTFQVVASYAGGLALLAALRDDAALSGTEYRQLRGHLSTAERLLSRGRVDEARASLARFAAAAWQVGDEEARAQLLEVAEALRSQLE